MSKMNFVRLMLECIGESESIVMSSTSVNDLFSISILVIHDVHP
jgi:hypothetical protein